MTTDRRQRDDVSKGEKGHKNLRLNLGTLRLGQRRKEDIMTLDKMRRRKGTSLCTVTDADM